MIKKITILLVVGLFTYTCATVPWSGRRQLSLVDNSEILPLSYEQYREVKSESKIVTNAADGQKVVKVGKRIASAVEQYLKENNYENLLEGFSWEFNLIEDDQVNAWCMPGGKVACYTGIMPICQDETGIAVVMGHEVAHAIANHSRQRTSQGLVDNGLLGGLQAARRQDHCLTQTLFLRAVASGGQVGMLKFSRHQELEADQLGLIY